VKASHKEKLQSRHQRAGTCLHKQVSTEPCGKLDVRQLKPYWMVEGCGAVANNVEMGDELIVLSGPNMGGKSTFLRSLVAAALLANCGLPIPAGPGGSVPEVRSSPRSVCQSSGALTIVCNMSAATTAETAGSVRDKHGCASDCF
jgi:hypothetical protein